MRRTHSLLTAIALAVVAAGCAGAAPTVKVLGVSEAGVVQSHEDDRKLSVYVQVVNPTRDEIQLSSLEYTLAAKSWFTSTGKVQLSRRLSADGAAVLELRVPFRQPAAGARIPYTLRGRLHANQRSWKVKANGVIERTRTGQTSRIQFRIAAK
jgi:hypothetical protein